MNNVDDPDSICSQQTHRIEVAGMPVDMVRKGVSELDLVVVPPLGQVRISVPLQADDDVVRRFVIERLAWIGQQQAAFAFPSEQPVWAMVSQPSSPAASPARDCSECFSSAQDSAGGPERGGSDLRGQEPAPPGGLHRSAGVR